MVSPATSAAGFLIDYCNNQGNARVVNLEVPDEVLIARLPGRGRQDDTESVILQSLTSLPGTNSTLN